MNAEGRLGGRDEAGRTEWVPTEYTDYTDYTDYTEGVGGGESEIGGSEVFTTKYTK